MHKHSNTFTTGKCRQHLKKDIFHGITLGRVSIKIDLTAVNLSFYEANVKYRVKKEISKAFETCGLNPYCLYDSVYKKHLISLDENWLYDSLTRKKEPVNCKGIDVLIPKK